MSFNLLQGQARIIDALQTALRSDRLSHAHVIFGPKGSGRFTLARELVKAYFCMQSREDACDQCGNCIRIASGQHPDAEVLQPAQGKTGLAVDAVRDVLRMIHRTPFEGEKRAVIFRDANFTVQAEAANALLKVLEEPPPHSLLIITAESLQDVQPTIVSRCNRIAIQRLDVDVLTGLLRNAKDLPPEAARFYAMVSDQSLGGAMRLAEENRFEEYRWLIQRIRHLTPDNVYRTSETLLHKMKQGSKKLAGQRDWLRQMTDEIAMFFRDLLLQCSGAGALAACPELAKDYLQSRTRDFGYGQIASCLHRVLETKQHITGNVHPPFIIDALLLDLTQRLESTASAGYPQSERVDRPGPA